MLHDEGDRVLEAGSGGAALDILEREPGSNVILDFATPGMRRRSGLLAHAGGRICRCCS